jgi:hypothetical protein
MSAKLLHYAELIVGGSPLCKRKAQAQCLIASASAEEKETRAIPHFGRQKIFDRSNADD